MGLFGDTRYFLASSIPPHRQEQLEYALSKNGATKADSLLSATHVITDSPWFEGVDVLENLKEERKANGEEGEEEEGVGTNMPVIVSDYWVDRTLVLGKIQPPQYYSVDPAMLFSGIVACAAELQAHDLEVLSAGISALGGQWRVALTNDVTHLFCVSPSSTKYAAALAHREGTGIKIVLPHWFDDSVRLGIRGLPVEPYEWPEPPFLKDIGVNVRKLGHAVQDDEEGKAKCEGEEDKLKEKAKKNMMVTANQFTPSATSSRTLLPKDVDLMPVKRGVFDNKRILLSWTLSLYSSRREAVEAGIRRAGGVVLRYPGDDDNDLSTEEKERRRDKKEARAVSECDILITRWRNGKAYGKAFELHKTVGTMAWLYHVQSSGLMPRPVDQLLHYPIPRKPIQSFLQHEITVTNYTGEAREYIKRIITAMGAKFTPMMTGKNTVLIAAYIHGQKTDKARAWSLPIVNHTWLEDCFIQWRHLTTSTDKYIMFPPGMDFSKLLGERGVGVRGVELCDEDEMKEDDEGSDDEVYVTEARIDEEQDKVLNRGIEEEEEDIDMISMPDTDDPGPNIVFEDAKPNSKISSKSRSPTKRSVVAASTSPTKRNVNDGTSSSAVQVSPDKSKSKSVSPTKRRRIVSDDDEEDEERIAVNRQPEISEDEERRHRKTKSTPRTPRKLFAMDTSSGEVTPARKLKQKPTPASKTTSSKRHHSVDLQLTDDSDNEIDGTPELIAKIRAKTNDTGEDGSPKKKRGIDKDKGKSPIKPRVVSSGDEAEERAEKNVDEDDDDNAGEDSLESKPKKRLVRRLTSEKSLQLAEQREKEKAEAEASSSTAKPKRLIRRANSKPLQPPVIQEPTETDAEYDKENVAESVTSTSKPKSSRNQVTKEEEKSDVPKVRGGLLKTKRGDARTRVKAKSATAKARELYSDSESEVEGIVEPKTQNSLRGKGKKKQETKSKKGAKSKKVTWSSDEEEEEPKIVESESDVGEEETKETLNSNSTPLKRVVSVVVELPPSQKKPQTKNTYAGSSKAKRKAKGAGDEAEENQTEEEKDDDELPTRTRSRREPVKKVDSIHVEAGEAPSTSTSRPKPKLKSKSVPTKSSPLSVTNTQNARANTNSTNTNDGNEISEQFPVRRGAAAKAEAKLKEMMPDATKYEQEAKKARKSGGWTSMWEKELEKEKEREKVVTGKKRNSDVVEDAEEEGPSRKRRRSSGVERRVKDEEVEESENGMKVEVKEVKKGRTSTSKDKIYLLTTQVVLASEVVKALEKLGVVMSSKVSQCTHLIAPSLVRTEKFLCALASAPIILQESWAVKSAQAKELLPTDKFLLRDTAAESKYRMKLSDALARAKEYKGTLFENKSFYVTTKTKVDYKLLKSVVTAHGGQLSQQTPTLRLLTGQADRHVVSCPEDISTWRVLAAQGIPIYTHEFLLLGVLKQELEWDLEEFRVLGSL